MKAIFASDVHYLSSENEAWKNLGLHGIWTHDLGDIVAVIQFGLKNT